jgi:drug/metabolite transporter (DMT)-like permease
MIALRQGEGDGRLVGISAVLGAWLVFALHDASIKLLVADFSAWQVLFIRSIIVLSACLLLRERKPFAGKIAPSARHLLSLNAVVYAIAWVAYYSAARQLQLPELETIYFASPIIATLLAVLLLRERVSRSHWIALAVGFSGVVLACGPASLQDTAAVWLGLLAAALWAVNVVLIRQLSASISTATQMLVNNFVFLLMCAVSAPWWWQLPGGRDLALMIVVGIAGLIAQWLLYEGIRRVPASLAAPLEYTGLLWSFGLGYLIWDSVPAVAVFLGAALIVIGGVLTIFAEWRAVRIKPEPAHDREDYAAAEPTISG